MTEIKIEKKKPVWPWILLLLAIAALVYFLVFRETEDGETGVEENQIESTSMMNTESQETFILEC
ncbi:MAG TPA: hypothetical protein VFQ50_09890 [Flavobacterium sp.]|nr:hypothetical protein [Flavobacterium sp.]